MTEQLTLAVIGHVDHGKTALVRSLTGIDTDRLKEEKERGLSIALGFSYLEGPRRTVDLIDVPGHEDFVRTMISGASGVDGALLIVAANEGIMPQTKEHLHIAQLLGMDRGLIVVTKVDLASREELRRLDEQIHSYVAGTFLRDAEVVNTSALTGQGLEDLRSVLGTLEPVADRGGVAGHAFLPVDRAFVMRGFGPIVTGTLRGGPLEANRKVDVLPGGLSATIRGLQVHNRRVDRVQPGQRVAVNLRNIKREDLRRGSMLASPGFLKATRRVDAELQLLASEKSPVKNGQTIRLLIGTKEVMARLRLLDCQRLYPGATGLVQLRCEKEIASPSGARFIIRSYSPMRTIGGGSILDVHPARHRRFDRSVTNRLETAAHGSLSEMVATRVGEAALRGTSTRTLCDELALDLERLNEALAPIRPVVINADKLVDRAAYVQLKQAILAEVASYHEAHPYEPGAAAGSLQGMLAAELDDDVLQQAINELSAEAQIVNNNGFLHLVSFDPLATLSERERQLAREIEEKFLRGGLAPPDFERMVGRDKTKRDLFRLLSKTGRLVKLRTHDRKCNLVLHANTLEDVVAQMREHFSGTQKFAVSDLRDLLGSTRKYIVPLIEHLDATGVTLRIGNLRQLRGENIR